MWALKVVAKVMLSRLPVPYGLWRRLGLFRHGHMDRGDYALKIFRLHVQRAFPAGLPQGACVLEMGPGDSIASALACAGGQFIGCPEPLYEQTATEGSDKTPRMNLQAELQLVDNHADYLRQRGRHVYARDWFKIRYYHFTGARLRFALALAWFLIRFPLAGTQHLLRSAPGRLQHEKKMTRKYQ